MKTFPNEKNMTKNKKSNSKTSHFIETVQKINFPFFQSRNIERKTWQFAIE
jgi:hypothetical protein